MNESLRVGSVWIGGAIALGIIAAYTANPIVIGVAGIVMLVACMIATVKLSS